MDLKEYTKVAYNLWMENQELILKAKSNSDSMEQLLDKFVQATNGKYSKEFGLPLCEVLVQKI